MSVSFFFFFFFFSNKRRHTRCGRDWSSTCALPILKSDYSLYRAFKSYLIKSINKLNNNKEMLKTVKENFKDLPKHLDVFDLSSIYPNETKSSENKDRKSVV